MTDIYDGPTYEQAVAALPDLGTALLVAQQAAAAMARDHDPVPLRRLVASGGALATWGLGVLLSAAYECDAVDPAAVLQAALANLNADAEARA
jgi:hypothetical protein